MGRGRGRGTDLLGLIVISESILTSNQIGKGAEGPLAGASQEVITDRYLCFADPLKFR